MPLMDGFEFVERLRGLPGHRHIRPRLPGHRVDHLHARRRRQARSVPSPATPRQHRVFPGTAARIEVRDRVASAQLPYRARSEVHDRGTAEDAHL